MTASLLRMIGEGYTAPRVTMRRLLDAGYGLEVALTFLALAFLVEAILATGYQGYIGQEFIPKRPDKLASLAEGVRICDV